MAIINEIVVYPVVSRSLKKHFPIRFFFSQKHFELLGEKILATFMQINKNIWNSSFSRVETNLRVPVIKREV